MSDQTNFLSTKHTLLSWPCLIVLGLRIGLLMLWVKQSIVCMHKCGGDY